MHCEPATSLIEKLGGIAAVSKVVEKSQTTVVRWRLPKERGGTGGVVPHWHHAALHAHAKCLGIGLTTADFIPAVAQPVAA